LFLDEEAFASGAPAGCYVSDLAVAQLGNQLLREHQGEGLFLFAITIGNHGPWSNAKPAVSSRDLAPALPTSSEAYAFRRFLGGLQESDAMLEAFSQGLAIGNESSLLAFYGDHQPSFPKLSSDIGHTDSQTDYCLWRTAAIRQPKRRDIAAHDLAHVILDSLAVTAPDAISI
jgi:hypothetical protein